MKKAAASLLSSVGRIFTGAAARIGRTDFDRELDRWYRADGEQTHRMQYDLNEHSVVLDVGSYKGQWASDIFARYQSTIHVFEPVAAFAEGLRARFARNPKIQVHQSALAKADGTAMLFVNDNESSMFVDAGKGTERITQVQADRWLAAQGIQSIDLLKIHTEGAEYDLIEHLIATGWIPKIRDLQVQFHAYAPDAAARLKRIRETLAKTHELTYQFPMVFENWRRR